MVSWHVRVRNREFVVNQSNLGRPGLSVGLRQNVMIARWDERCESCRGARSACYIVSRSI